MKEEDVRLVKPLRLEAMAKPGEKLAGITAWEEGGKAVAIALNEDTAMDLIVQIFQVMHTSGTPAPIGIGRAFPLVPYDRLDFGVTAEGTAAVFLARIGDQALQFAISPERIARLSEELRELGAYLRTVPSATPRGRAH